MGTSFQSNAIKHKGLCLLRSTWTMASCSFCRKDEDTWEQAFRVMQLNTKGFAFCRAHGLWPAAAPARRLRTCGNEPNEHCNI